MAKKNKNKGPFPIQDADKKKKDAIAWWENHIPKHKQKPKKEKDETESN